MLVPTFIVWSATIGLLSVVTRNRYRVFAVAAVILAYTFYRQVTGHINWVGNWNLWGMAQLERHQSPGAGRQPRFCGIDCSTCRWPFCWRTAACGCSAGSRLMRRGSSCWFRASSMTRTLAAGHALPVAAAADRRAICGCMVWHGHEAGPAKRKQKDYWRQNMATWTDAPLPALQHVVLDLRLDPDSPLVPRPGSVPPAESAVRAAASDRTHRRIRVAERALDAQWPALRTGRPLATDGVFPERRRSSRRTTWRSGSSTKACSRRASARRAGVRRSSFSRPASCSPASPPSFVPVVGFVDGAGVDEENRHDSKQYDDFFYEGDTLPLFGDRRCVLDPHHHPRTAGVHVQLGGCPGVVVGGRVTNGPSCGNRTSP